MLRYISGKGLIRKKGGMIYADQRSRCRKGRTIQYRTAI